MTWLRLLIIFSLISVILLILLPAAAFAQELDLPCRFYGTVKVVGHDVPYGTVITAIIEGDIYTTETPSLYGVSSYDIKIQPPEGTFYSDGTPVTFKIGDYAAVQTPAWKAGGNIEFALYDAQSPVPVTDTYVSDSSTLVAVSYDTVTYSTSKQAVATWVHPDWPTIGGATWISDAYRIENPRKLSYRKFEKAFTVPEHAINISGTLEITADWGYHAYLNDFEIGRSQTATSIETISVNTVPGNNTLTIYVFHLERRGSNWQTNPTGLIFKLTVDYELPPKPASTPTPTPPPTLEPTPTATPVITLAPTPPITPPPTPPTTPDNSSSLNMGKVIGIAIFGMADILLIGLLIWLVWKFFLRPEEQK